MAYNQTRLLSWIHTMCGIYSWCVMCKCVKKIRRIWHIQFALMCLFIAQLAAQMWRMKEWHIYSNETLFSYTRCANHDAWRITNTNHASCGPSFTGNSIFQTLPTPHHVPLGCEIFSVTALAYATFLVTLHCVLLFFGDRETYFWNKPRS